MEIQKILAKTLSVLSSPSSSILCYVEINEESCNLTLNLEGDRAKLLGYPNHWKIWDEIIDGDLEARTYEEAFNNPEIESFFHEIVSIDIYVSRTTEKEIFRQLRIELEAQFQDEDFKDDLKESEKEEVLRKFDLSSSLL